MSHRRHYLRTTAASALALALLLPACADSPTQVIEVERLEGLWEITAQANTFCSPNALARSITFSLDTVNVGDGVNRFQGLWEAGGASIVGSGYSGEYDAPTRQVTMTFVHTGTGRVIIFEGRATRNDRMSGRLVPPSGREPYWNVGGCEQSATARKTQEYPLP